MGCCRRIRNLTGRSESTMAHWNGLGEALGWTASLRLSRAFSTQSCLVVEMIFCHVWHTQLTVSNLDCIMKMLRRQASGSWFIVIVSVILVTSSATLALSLVSVCSDAFFSMERSSTRLRLRIVLSCDVTVCVLEGLYLCTHTTHEI